MNTKDLALKIKELRKRKEFTQQELSDRTGLSLRTIQRIEKGETTPRGHTLKQLANALEVYPSEITVSMREDKGFLLALNLSGLSSLLLSPVIGFFVPFTLWITKKDKINGVNKIGKEVINFQLTWTLGFLGTMLYFVIHTVHSFDIIQRAEVITPEMVESQMWYVKQPASFILIIGGLILFNILSVSINTYKISKDKEVNYLPKINFIG